MTETKFASSARRFGRDTTERLSCRKGEYLIWMYWPGFFETKPEVMDVWQLDDSDHVLITNRFADIPPWFELHPLETQGAIARDMKTKLDAGYQPTEPIDGPNIWRVMAGDRFAWVGGHRSGKAVEECVKGIISFEENALVLGNSDHNPDPIHWMEVNQTDEGIALFRLGARAALSLGAPRTMAVDRQWRVG